ncbi:MAG: endolytic transglycosylase MltG [Gemella sp.]|nr:endolytic transglycosylase MltG [Gemella sp.]
MDEKRIKRREELRKKNKKKKKRGDLFAIVLSIFIVLGIAMLSWGYYVTTPVDKDSTEKVTVEIKESYGASVISDLLIQKDLIKSSLMFKLYSKFGNYEEFYIGNYEISKNMTLSEILKVLTTKSQGKSGITVSVIDGDNIAKIANKVSEVTDISPEEFINKTNDQEFINKLKVDYPNLITNELDSPNLKYKLEGYLYPAKYDIDDRNKTNPEILIRSMIEATETNVLPLYNLSNKVWNINNKDVPISIHQYITMASILEKESTSATDNGAIAGVFMNRLKINMPLQTDPSVMYSLNNRVVELSFEDLKNQDPYNTYTNTGLTPGPISSPSKRSYDALNNVVKHDYLYFLTDKDGKAYFATTYAEHEVLAREHIPGYVSTN